MHNLIKVFDEATFAKKILLIFGLFLSCIVVGTAIKVIFSIAIALTTLVLFITLPLIAVVATAYFIYWLIKNYKKDKDSVINE